MLRVHFTAGDLARTRVADGPDPLWQSVLSLHQLRKSGRNPPCPTGPGASCATVRRRYACCCLSCLPAATSRTSSPPRRDRTDSRRGLDAMLSTPRRQLRAQIGRSTTGPTAPRNGGPLGRRCRGRFGAGPAPPGEGAARLPPHRARQFVAVRARERRSRPDHARPHSVVRRPEAMLRTFGPVICWRAPVLECDYPCEMDIRLDGRGLLLIPSYFCRCIPVALADPALPPTLGLSGAHRGSRGAAPARRPCRSAPGPSARAHEGCRAPVPRRRLHRRANSPGARGCRSPPRASTRRCCAAPG